VPPNYKEVNNMTKVTSVKSHLLRPTESIIVNHECFFTETTGSLTVRPNRAMTVNQQSVFTVHQTESIIVNHECFLLKPQGL